MRADLDRTLPIRTYLHSEKPIAALQRTAAEMRSPAGDARPVSIAYEIKKP